MSLTRCQSCRARIEFVKTERGRAMPLDVDPTPDGNVEIRDGIAHVLGPLEKELVEDPSRLRMPHHATCPDAHRWRGGSK